MIHTFSFNYHDKAYYFLWDIEGGSLHNIDRAAFLVSKKLYLSLDPEEQKEYDQLSDVDKQDIASELTELEAEGALNTKAIKYPVLRAGDIKAMCLHICHDCNFSCKYCFAHDGTYNTERDYMSFEVGKASIDFLIAHSGKRHNLEVDFFGGEPLMNLGVVKKIVEYAKEEVAKVGKSISFTMTTNCLLLDDDTMNYLNDTMDNVVLSIDGRPEVHNRMRRTINGKDTQELVRERALRFRAIRGDKKYYVRGTFTGHNLDFASDVLYLADLGFDQVSVEPVVCEAKEEYSIHPEHLPLIEREYERLATEYLDRRKHDDTWFNFFHFMLDLKNGPCVTKRLTGCGAGREYVAVTPVGDIFPCHQFVDKPDFYMGNVLTGVFNRDIQKKFADVVVYNKPNCENCFAKYYCSGGCSANALNYAGDIFGCHEMSCAMMKKRFELSLAIYAIENMQENL